VLLHEEGHIRKGSSLTSALPALPMLPCLALLHNLPSTRFRRACCRFCRPPAASSPQS
jgi:hypothetical protein